MTRFDTWLFNLSFTTHSGVDFGILPTFFAAHRNAKVRNAQGNWLWTDFQNKKKTLKNFKKTSGGDLVWYINMKEDRFWGFRMTESLFNIHCDQIHAIFMPNSMFWFRMDLLIWHVGSLTIELLYRDFTNKIIDLGRYNLRGIFFSSLDAITSWFTQFLKRFLKFFFLFFFSVDSQSRS